MSDYVLTIERPAPTSEQTFEARSPQPPYVLLPLQESGLQRNMTQRHGVGVTPSSEEFSVTRPAPAAVVRRLRMVASGRSGRSDISERIEEILAAEVGQ